MLRLMQETKTDRRSYTIRLAVEVDESAWAHVYGDTPPELRASVESYVVAALSQSAAAIEGALVTAQVIGR